MNGHEKAYLTLDRNSIDDSDMEYDVPRKAGRKGRNWTQHMLTLTLLALVLSNAAWIWAEAHRVSSKVDNTYWNSDKTVLKPFHWDTKYASDNKTETNMLWKNLFPTGQGVVYLPHEWARVQQLPISMKNPNNESEGMYFVSAYHHLHCLSVARAAMYHWKEGKEQTVAWEHMIHCLDSVRQSIMCSADDTLLYSEDGKVFGDGQIHQCRDWSALESWVLEHDHHA